MVNGQYSAIISLMKDKQNIFLDGLEYGEELLNKGEPITFNKIVNHLKDKGYKIESKSEEALLKDFARENFYIYVSGEEETWKNYESNLNAEGYFKLLDYKELNEARKSSTQARKYAILAILVSIFASIISIYVSLQPITIDTTQFQTFQNILDILEKKSELRK